jgi:FkbM family methyltransferase
MGIRPVGIEGVGTLAWPENDTNAFHWPMQDWINGKGFFMQHVKKRDVVIQAGGCCGMYPRFYANYFKKVYTFEPNKGNYAYLEMNCKNTPNIISRNVALGSSHSMVSMYKPDAPGEEYNVGMYTIDESPGDVEMVTLDSLGIESCDLIHFDMEGYEMNALIGARNLIETHSPVIIVEHGNGKEFLQELGYVLVNRLSMDAVYVRSK